MWNAIKNDNLDCITGKGRATTGIQRAKGEARSQDSHKQAYSFRRTSVPSLHPPPLTQHALEPRLRDSKVADMDVIPACAVNGVVEVSTW